ncbi:cysteine-rich with EGF-like domain protein 1 [Dendronephthya gigantea]|uniref:cysteine-rich with EGF-like domain protein 1 n=1 Tax=Dendronephthya gigantea TaxID=151771 RepID=UPI00106D98EA|nr:cysteine-rich with EGF-like domain protein 1 [Dendronephthya gigantea]
MRKFVLTDDPCVCTCSHKDEREDEDISALPSSSGWMISILSWRIDAVVEDWEERFQVEQSWDVTNLKDVNQEDESSDQLFALREQPVTKLCVRKETVEASQSGSSNGSGNTNGTGSGSASGSTPDTDNVVYVCDCPAGYKANGSNCTDINECMQSPCGANANCTNTQGSFACECRVGYEGNGTNCTEIDECQSPSCHSNATCNNTDGSYICTCNSGYSGDGFNCTDINECQTDFPCYTNATCNNTDGSYICTCDSEYTGDGFNCTGRAT